MPTEKLCMVIKSDGQTEVLDHKPTLEEAQKIVGGYVEIANGGHFRGKGGQLIVNEDGLNKNLPYNTVASNIYKRSPIVGDAIWLQGWRF